MQQQLELYKMDHVGKQVQTPASRTNWTHPPPPTPVRSGRASLPPGRRRAADRALWAQVWEALLQDVDEVARDVARDSARAAECRALAALREGITSFVSSRAYLDEVRPRPCPAPRARGGADERGRPAPALSVWAEGHAAPRGWYGVRDAACPISTGRRTRRVRLVRGEGRGVST
jgi:hypothetical protein